MNGTTSDRDHGPGRRFVTTPYGLYSIPQAWEDRPMPSLSALTDFLTHGDTSEWGMTIARLHQLADAEPEARAILRDLMPRLDAALYHWQNLSPLYPIKDAHGPTMGQLLDRLNEQNPSDDDEQLQADNVLGLGRLGMGKVDELPEAGQ